MRARTSSGAQRRSARFGLRLLLVALVPVAAASALLGERVHRLRQKRALISEVERLGGNCAYDWQIANASPPKATWIEEMLGEHDLFSDIVDVGLVPVDGRADYAAGDDFLSLAAGVPTIKSLVVYDAAITDAGLGRLRNLRSLSVLCLIRTPITDAGLDQLATMKNLRYVQLAYTRVTDEGVRKLTAALPQCHVDTAPGPYDTPGRSPQNAPSYFP